MLKRHYYGDWIKYLDSLDKYIFISKKKDGVLYILSTFSTIILSIILIFSGLIFFPILAIILSIMKIIFFKYFLYDEFKNTSIEDSSKFNYGLNIIFYFVAILITIIYFVIYFIIIYFYQSYKLKSNISLICFKIQFIIIGLEILFGILFTILSQKIIAKFCKKYYLEKDGEEEDDKAKKKVKIVINE